MKTAAFAIILALGLVALLSPDMADGRPQQRRRKFRGSDPRQARTALPQDYPEPPSADYDSTDNIPGNDGTSESGDLPDWCNYVTNMGAWLNFGNVRTICGERGFSEFGPYGGVPAEEEGSGGGEEEVVEA